MACLRSSLFSSDRPVRDRLSAGPTACIFVLDNRRGAGYRTRLVCLPNDPSPSSRGLGHGPFTPVTGVRLPVGTPIITRGYKQNPSALSGRTSIRTQEPSELDSLGVFSCLPRNNRPVPNIPRLHLGSPGRGDPRPLTASMNRCNSKKRHPFAHSLKRISKVLSMAGLRYGRPAGDEAARSSRNVPWESHDPWMAIFLNRSREFSP